MVKITLIKHHKKGQKENHTIHIPNMAEKN